MKKLLAIVAVVIGLFSCNNEKNQEETLLKDVINLHDEVMGLDDKRMHNKMQLDTLILQSVDTIQKAEMTTLRQKLDKAGEAMENWMQNFDPSQKGKTHEQIVTYLEGQKKQVIGIDSQITQAVKEADNYLLKIKK